jgi:drug/metabolite transporter (DMT)-like permease
MKKDHVLYIASLLLFGSNGIVAAAIPLPSTQIVVLRTFIGTMLLVAVIAFSRDLRGLHEEQSGLKFVLASGVCTGLSWVTLYEAYRLVGVGVSSLLYYCAPIVVMIVSVPLFGEKMTMRGAGGFTVVLAGTVLVGAQASAVGGSVTGVVLAALSALCHAGMVICSKKAPEVSGLRSSAIQLAVSCLIALPFLAGEGGLGFLVDIPSDAWPAILFLGLANTGLGCLMYFTSVPRLPAQTVATLGYLEPLSAVVLSALLLGETLSALQWVGAVMIIGGALFGEQSRATAAVQQ